MSSSKFELKEIVTVKNKEFPVVGGRLRLAHAEGIVGITTELVHYSDAKIVMKATVTMPSATTPGGPRTFTGYGEADTQRDAKLKDAILELAETRAIARALRFAGYGVEYTGAEEVSHVRDDEPRSFGNATPTTATAGVKGVTEELHPGYKPPSSRGFA